MAKTEGTYLIAHGASVTVVRDGKRVPIPAGGGAFFTDAEIATIRRTSPGALRKPINEGTGKVAAVEDDDDDDTDDTAKKTAAPTGGKKAKAKAKPADKKPAADADDDDDEDI